jgi:four helix bundle protein
MAEFVSYFRLMARLRSYRDLEVWQRSITLVEQAYKLTASFPLSERYGLSSQLQRAAVSISLNIAEGYGRSHRGDYLRFLSIAKGSVAEVETLLIISVRLGFVTRDETLETWETCQQVAQMLSKLIASLKQ